MTVPTAYKDEFLLLRWSDNSRDGMTVTFQIPGEYAEHPFKFSATGKKTGKRYAAVLVEIGDDEKPVIQEKSKPGPLCLEAIGLCKREDFQQFASIRRYAKGWTYTPTEDGAKVFLADMCGISSRKELDHNATAASRFGQVKSVFLEWQR